MTESSLFAALTKRLRDAEAERDELREKLASLEFVFKSKCTTPVAWGLTRQQKRLFATLLVNKLATHEQLSVALNYNSSKDHSDVVLRVQIRRLRVKLAPFGISIAVVWGIGYAMSGATKNETE